MGRRAKGEFPQVRIHKQRGHARLRFGNRTIWLGKAGSREAEENRQRVHAAWLANGQELPADFALRPDEPVVPIPDLPRRQGLLPSVLTVGDLVADAMIEIAGGRTKAELRNVSRWDRIKAAAVALEPFARTPAIEFGPIALGGAAADSPRPACARGAASSRR